MGQGNECCQMANFATCVSTGLPESALETDNNHVITSAPFISFKSTWTPQMPTTKGLHYKKEIKTDPSTELKNLIQIIIGACKERLNTQLNLFLKKGKKA